MTVFLGDVKFSLCWSWGFRPSGMWYCITELVIFNLPLKYASPTQWHSLTSQMTQVFIILWLSFFYSSAIWWVMVSGLGQVCRKDYETCSYSSLNFLHNSMFTIFTCTLCTLFNMLALEKYFFIKIRYAFVQFLCFNRMSYLSSWLHAVELCKVR
jgi:hypothetical protein